MSEDEVKPLDAQAILLSIGEAVIEIDRERKINIWNQAAERLVGVPSREVLGKSYSDALRIVREDGEAPGYDFIAQTFLEGEGNVTPKRAAIVTIDNRRVPVVGSAAPVRDREGNIIGVVVALRDITAERQIENVKTEFLSLASHQLRTPLSGIKWLIETLMAKKIGPLTNAQGEYLSYIAQSNERMIKLVQDLLAVIRLEGEEPVLALATFRVADLLEECYEFSRLAAEKKNLSFRAETAGKEMAITADRALLKAILDILISNAINYSREGGNVALRASHENEFIEFSVADEGIGIPREERRYLFTKFYRASNAKAMRPEGTGLGLYIAKFLAGTLGGVIRVESIEGKGSTFRLIVPAGRAGGEGGSPQGETK